MRGAPAPVCVVVEYVTLVVIFSTHVDGKFFRRLSVYLSLFRRISQKVMQLGYPNLTQKCSTMSPGNLFILGSEGQRLRSRGTKTVLAWVLTLVSAGVFWFYTIAQF